MGTRALPHAPTFAFDRDNIECQEDACQRKIVEQIAQVYDTTLDALKATARADGAQYLTRQAADKVSHAARAGQVEKPAKQHGGDERDDLVVGARRYEQPYGRIRRCQQDRRQIAAEDRSPVKVPEQRYGDGQGKGQCQGNGNQCQNSQEFSHSQPDVGDRQREQYLQRTGALFFAPLAHRQRRDEKYHQHWHRTEERPDICDASGEKSVDPEEREQPSRQESTHEDDRHWRAKILRQLFARNCQYSLHRIASRSRSQFIEDRFQCANVPSQLAHGPVQLPRQIVDRRAEIRRIGRLAQDAVRRVIVG